MNRAWGIGHGALGMGHWALGIGHWALGMGHGALGMGHWAWGIERNAPLVPLVPHTTLPLTSRLNYLRCLCSFNQLAESSF